MAFNSPSTPHFGGVQAGLNLASTPPSTPLQLGSHTPPYNPPWGLNPHLGWGSPLPMKERKAL